jgi:hypothetical protein
MTAQHRKRRLNTKRKKIIERNGKSRMERKEM